MERISAMIPPIFQGMIQTKSDPVKKERYKKYLPMIEDDLRALGIDTTDPKHLSYLLAKTITREAGKGLILYGPRGNGKTTRLKYLNEIKRIPIIPARLFGQAWIDCGGETPEFLEYCHCDRCRWSERPPTYNDMIIDDLGLEEVSYNRYGTASDVMLNVVLPMRYEIFMNRRALTHFTTNMTPDQVRKRYGETVWSRLNEMCVFIPMRHSDRRITA